MMIFDGYFRTIAWEFSTILFGLYQILIICCLLISLRIAKITCMHKLQMEEDPTSNITTSEYDITILKYSQLGKFIYV